MLMLWFHRYYIYTRRYVVNQYYYCLNYIRKNFIYLGIDISLHVLKNSPLDREAMQVFNIALIEYYDVIDNVTLTIILEKIIHLITMVYMFFPRKYVNINNDIMYIVSLYENKYFSSAVSITMHIFEHKYVLEFEFENSFKLSRYCVPINYDNMIKIMNNIKRNKIKIRNNEIFDTYLQNRLLLIGNKCPNTNNRSLFI